VNHPSSVTSANLAVEKITRERIKKKVVFQLPNLSSDQQYTVHEAGIENLERAVLERVFFVKDDNGVFITPPKAEPKTWNRRMAYFRSRLIKCLPSPTVWSRQQFVDSFNGRKKTLYWNALKTFEQRGLDFKDSFIQVFGKCERTNITEKPDAVMRVISPRGKIFNIEVGRFLKPLEKSLYQAIDDIFHEPTVMKGYNVKQLAGILSYKWNGFRQPVAIGIDAKRFDQHCGETALKWEHSVYKGIFPFEHKFHTVLDWQVENKCFGYTYDGKLKYKSSSRASGDVNTGSGNTCISAGMLHAFMKFCKVSHYSAVVNGDDVVLIVDKKHLSTIMNKLKSWYFTMGFQMEVSNPVDVFEQIEFCQMSPVVDKDGYLMVRKPKYAIAKDCISIKPLDNVKVFKKWVSAVGQGGLSIAAGMPIFQEFYTCLIRAASGVKPLRDDPTQDTGMMVWSVNMARNYSDISEETRESFYYAFGVLPDSQVSIENYYRNQNLNYESGFQRNYTSSDVCF